MPEVKKKILVVDDEPAITLLIDSFLNRIGPDYEMLKAFDKENAMEIIDSKKPDLVILDIDLYGVNSGIEILKIINEKYKSTKVIVITGRAKHHRVQIEKIGCFRFFEKPVDARELDNTVKDALGIKRIIQEKEPQILTKTPRAKLLFIEPDVRHYAYLCSLFDVKEMLDGANYQVKVLYRLETLLNELALFQPDVVIIGDYFLEERQLEAITSLIQSDIKIKPKIVLIHGLFERDELFKARLKKMGIGYCAQSVMDNEEILKMNKKLVDFVGQECVEGGLVE